MREILGRLRPLTAGLCLAAAIAGGASAQPFTVDDMLRVESFGSASVSPDQRFIVFERRGGYETADRFDLTYLGAVQTNTVWIATPDGAAPQRLLPEEEGRGHVLGPWSPSGRRLVVHRLQGDDWETGIVDIGNRSVRWLGLGAEPPTHGESVIWRSDDELILVVRTDRRMPYDISGVSPGLEAMTARWAAVRRGDTAVSEWGGGAFAEATGFAAPTELIRIDVTTGRQTLLMPGRALDMAVSPDRRWLAVVDRGAPYPVRSERPFRPLEQPDRRGLTVVDLVSGSLWSPCGLCDVGPALLGWSPDGNRLLVWIRDEAVSPEAGGLAAFDPVTRIATAYDLDGFEPHVSASAETSFAGVRAEWQGDRPVIQARRAGADRVDWLRLEAVGPRNLTADFVAAPQRIEAIDGDRLLVIADGAAWRIGLDGVRTEIAGDGLTAVPGLDRQGFPRLRLNAAPRRDWMFAAAPDGGVETVTAAGRRQPLLAPQDPALFERTTPLAASPNLIVSRHILGAVEHLELRTAEGGGGELMRLNDWAVDIDFAAPIPVRHVSPTGDPLTSWLYRPPSDLPSVAGPDGALPMIVVGYPGGSGRPQPNPAEFNVMANIQLLSAKGYAVLVPTLPRLDHDDPAEGLGEQILTVVDAALAQNPDLDPSRLGYLGHSFGGYAGLVLATQSSRFSSFVILSAPSDLAGFWGGFSGFGRSNREFGVTSRRNAGWGEEGQAAIGGPPWERGEAYVRASPVYSADRITAPVLLVHGELDFIPIGQAESMFTALWRQNKDVQLATYWGEWHLIQSPANIRDLLDRISRWLEKTVSPSASARLASVPGALPIDASRPPGTLSPEPPLRRHASADGPHSGALQSEDGR